MEGILCSSQGPGGTGRAITRPRCQAGWITMGGLGRRHDRSQGHTESQLTETAWPDMGCLAFTLSHRPHTHNADTCTQGFPGIICPAFRSASALVTSFLPPLQPHMDTNKHKHVAVLKHMRAHAHTAVLTLPSFGLSLVGVVSPVLPLIAVSPAGTHPSRLSLLSISASDWDLKGMSCLSAEDLVQGFITSSMPSQFPLNVLFQTGPLKFLSELSGQSSVRLKRLSMRRTRSLGSDTQREKDRRTVTETVHLDR